MESQINNRSSNKSQLGLIDSRMPNTNSRHLRILLAEDNPVNQKLAIKLIEKHGHTVLIASNGQEVIEALEKDAFDIILMDVQMPIMDGLITTAKIREQEENSGQHIPIIAMTANSEEADIEQSRAVGMDGHLSKPLQTLDLFNEIDRLLPTSHADPVISFVPKEVQIKEQLDRAAIFRRFNEDVELMHDIVDMFLETYPQRMEEVREAIDAKDGDAISRSAHTLKGLIGIFTLKGAYEVAFQLEKIGEAKALTEAETAWLLLEDELKALSSLVALLKSEDYTKEIN
jgi:two-component system, sensor histidine kinase and response regulator